jgi:hypothetical protein
VLSLEEEDEEEEGQCKEEKHEEVIKYRMHQYQENPNMEITGDDAELVMNCDHCGPWVTECVREDCDDFGQGWAREDYTPCIIGNDVVSLFPSLESATAGKIVREEVARSTMTVEGFNVKLGLKYMAMNEKLTSNLEPMRQMLPWRMTKPGVQPTMKSKFTTESPEEVAHFGFCHLDDQGDPVPLILREVHEEPTHNNAKISNE